MTCRIGIAIASTVRNVLLRLFLDCVHPRGQDQTLQILPDPDPCTKSSWDELSVLHHQLSSSYGVRNGDPSQEFSAEELEKNERA